MLLFVLVCDLASDIGLLAWYFFKFSIGVCRVSTGSQLR